MKVMKSMKIRPTRLAVAESTMKVMTGTRIGPTLLAELAMSCAHPGA
jgi:hypothetical protein